MMKKLFLIFLMAILLLQVFVEASSISLSNDVTNSPPQIDGGNAVVALDKKPHLPKINCNSACSKRCKKSSRKKICKRACKSCCIKCHCVPPGTYGHTNACPCYARLRTHGNRLKCP